MSQTKRSVPKHIAIIMDGNGRWAKKRWLPRAEGHRRGVKALERIVEHAGRLGVRVLTVFAFSSENWRRPQTEVDTLMQLFASGLRQWVKPLVQSNVRLSVIGDRRAFSKQIQRAITRCERATKHCTGLRLVIAANYGGRWDVYQAMQSLLASGKEVTFENFSSCMMLADMPEVDLMIRTGGEQRISNFLLWQAAYAELYFDRVLWPDFDEACLDRAIAWFHERRRRFGMTSEQVRDQATGV